MSKIVSVCLLITVAASVVWVAAFAPRWLNDNNDFLKGFVNHELLAVLGVVLAITLASSAQLHLKFNEIDERARARRMESSRREVKSSAYWMIGLYVAAVVLVLVKPIFVRHSFAVAFINGSSLYILLVNILIMFDITAGIFAIPPQIERADTQSVGLSSPGRAAAGDDTTHPQA